MNKLVQLYQKVLLALGVHINEDYSLWIKNGNELIPLMINDLHIYLPVDEVIKGNCTTKVLFHPACESIISKETEMFKIIRGLVSYNILVNFKKYPEILWKIAEKKQQRNLRNDIVEIITPIKESIKESKSIDLKELLLFIAKISPSLSDEDTVDNRLIHFTITKGGKDKQTGESVYYKSKPSFPFYEEMVKKLARSESLPDNQTLQVNGINITKHLLKLAIHVYETVIPACKNPDYYEVNQTTSTGARFSALLKGYATIMDDMNKLQHHFRNEFDKEGVYTTDLSWIEDLDNLIDIFRLLPSYKYNDYNYDTNEDSNSKNHVGNMFSVKVNNDVNLPAVVQGVTTTSTQQSGELDIDGKPMPPLNAGDQYVNRIEDPISRRITCVVKSVTGEMVNYIYTINKSLLTVEKQGALLPNNFSGLVGNNVGSLLPSNMLNTIAQQQQLQQYQQLQKIQQIQQLQQLQQQLTNGGILPQTNSVNEPQHIIY